MRSLKLYRVQGHCLIHDIQNKKRVYFTHVKRLYIIRKMYETQQRDINIDDILYCIRYKWI